MNRPECSICYNPYVAEGDNEPKVLPCAHTFCGKCLQEINPKNCPTCNKQFVNANVKTNFGLRDILPKSMPGDRQQEPPLKKYKSSSNMSIEELQKHIEEKQQELKLRQHNEAQTKLIIIRESLSVVVLAINKQNKEIETIGESINKAEVNLKMLKEKRVYGNKELVELQLKEANLKNEETRLISLINYHPGTSSSGNNNIYLA